MALITPSNSSTAPLSTPPSSSSLTISDETIHQLSDGILTIYEKPFKTIEHQLDELLLRQNKLINAVQLINNNKDRNYKNKMLLLEEICVRINGLVRQIKTNHTRMIEITKTVKTMKTNALKVKKYSLDERRKRQEQLLKEQNLVVKSLSGASSS